jgi:hypothetical protein
MWLFHRSCSICATWLRGEVPSSWENPRKSSQNFFMYIGSTFHIRVIQHTVQSVHAWDILHKFLLLSGFSAWFLCFFLSNECSEDPICRCSTLSRDRMYMYRWAIAEWQFPLCCVNAESNWGAIRKKRKKIDPALYNLDVDGKTKMEILIHVFVYVLYKHITKWEL